MKRKLLLIFLHGFGDNIMATPAVKELSKIHNVDIVIYKKTLADKLWSNLKFINKVYSIDLPYHPRYWNPIMFWLKDYWMVKKEIKKIVDLSQYDKIIFSKIYTLPHIVYNLAPFLLKRYHKIDQIAYDLGIDDLKNKKTLIKIPNKFIQKADSFLKKHNIGPTDKIMVMHLLTESTAERDFPLPLAQKLVNTLNDEYDNLKFIILGSKYTWVAEFQRYSMHLKGSNIIYTFNNQENEDILTGASLISKSKLFIGIDSGPFHIAGALHVNSIGIFRTNRIKSDQRKAYNENIYCYDNKNIDLTKIREKIKKLLYK